MIKATPSVVHSTEHRAAAPPTLESTPTPQAYGELQLAYDHFNATLFDGKLPPCLITLQRKGRSTLGYYAHRRFASAAGKHTDEIALNPAFFKTRGFIDVMSTLVHEMVHLWQAHFGRRGRRCYHDREWAGMMLYAGLHPSHTGEPGGRMTGQRMTHFVVPGGRFDVAVKELRSKLDRLTWFDANPAVLLPKGLDAVLHGTRPASGRRTKFCCPDCGAQAWGKPSLNLICATCERPMPPAHF